MSPSRFDQVAAASDAGRFRFAPTKFKRLYPKYFRIFGRKSPGNGRNLDECYQSFQQHLEFGDTRAAVVVSTSPLQVAAYTDELDCVAMLGFPDRPKVTGKLEVGSRLLTSNTYKNYPSVVSDLRPGPRDTGNWQNFAPLIADFFTEDQFGVQQRKEAIAQNEWELAAAFGQQYLEDLSGYVRDGCPLECEKPGTPEHLMPKRRTCDGPPDFMITETGLERFRQILIEQKLPIEEMAVAFSTSGEHPEIFNRQMGFILKLDANPKEFYSMNFEDIAVAILREDADRFDKTVLGFDTARQGFIFHNKS